MNKYIEILKNKNATKMIDEIQKDDNTHLFSNDVFIKTIFDNYDFNSNYNIYNCYQTQIKFSVTSDIIEYIFKDKKVNANAFALFDDNTQIKNIDLLLEIKKDKSTTFPIEFLSKKIRSNANIMEKIFNSSYILSHKDLNHIIINKNNKNDMLNMVKKINIALNSKILKKLGIDKDFNTPNLLELKQIAMPFEQDRDKILEKDYKTPNGYLKAKMEKFFIDNHHHLSLNEFSKIIDRYYDLYSLADLLRNPSIKERFEKNNTGYSYEILQNEFKKHNIKIA